MKNGIGVIAGLFFVGLCISALVGVAILGERFTNSQAVLPTPTAPVVLVDPGVVLTHSNIRAIVGTGAVAVHTSLADTPYRAATMTDETGLKHFWVPASMPACLASLNLEEGQEYILRRLATCGTCEYDTSADILDPKVMDAMVRDTNVIRVSEPSNMMQLAFANFAERALEVQAEVAKAGFESNVQIAAAGSAAVVGSSAAQAAGQSFTAVAVIVVVVGAAFVVLKGAAGKGG